MNPGYLSLLLMVVTLILFASGWKDLLVRGITSKVILLFFISWFIATKFSLTLKGGKINFCIAVLCILIICVLWRAHGWLYRIHILSAGALLGSIYFFMLETIHLVPAWIMGSTEISMALLIGALVSGLTRLPAVQLASVSIGLLLAELYRGYMHRDFAGFQLGFPLFQDRWWLTVYMTRICSLLLASAMFACKKSVHWVTDGIRRMSGGDSE